MRFDLDEFDLDVTHVGSEFNKVNSYVIIVTLIIHNIHRGLTNDIHSGHIGPPQ
jgi:hypothetical protein